MENYALTKYLKKTNFWIKNAWNLHNEILENFAFCEF